MYIRKGIPELWLEIKQTVCLYVLFILTQNLLADLPQIMIRELGS